MAEAYLRQGGLAHLGLDAHAALGRGDAGVAMADQGHRTIINLRGKPGDQAFVDAVEGVLGTTLPREPNTAVTGGGRTAIWLSPEEWWVIGPDDQGKLAATLRTALEGVFSAVTEVGESRVVLRISGPKARDLLAKGCFIDFHGRAFAPGASAQTVLAKATVLIHRIDAGNDSDPAFEVYVLRSFSDYLWHWLADAAKEYGLAVVKA